MIWAIPVESPRNEIVPSELKLVNPLRLAELAIKFPTAFIVNATPPLNRSLIEPLDIV